MFICLQVFLLVVVKSVFGDTESLDGTQNYVKDSKEIRSAEERSASSGGRRGAEYTPREKDEYNLSLEEGQESPLDGATDAATRYTSVSVESGHQRSMQYKTTRPSKVYTKTYRQAAGSNYKPYRTSKLVEKQKSSSLEPFIPAVHPSVMRNLLKQEPQTFADSQQRQPQEAEQGPSNWEVSSNSDTRFGKKAVGFSLQRDHGGRRGVYDINKTPIYVPNRVNVQNPSSDSSFNVGYSIGFGNGQPHSIRADFNDPSTNVRHGNALSVPLSYQDTPANLHFNGRDTFWKNMGSGVEISQSVDVNPNTYQSYNSEPASDHKIQPSSPVTPQPSYSSDGLDHGFDDYPTPGRYSFDHNHALQQSNYFDISNAIDPATNKPYSVEKLNQITKESFGDPFSKSLFSSFTDTMTIPYFESSPRQSKPSHVEYSKESSASSHQTHSGNRQGKFNPYKHDNLRYERPFSDGSVNSQSSVTYHPKPVAIDFSKSLSSSSKEASPPNFPLKAISTMNTHQISITNHDNNLGFPGFPITPHMHTPASKIPHSGMIQAILVPVNAPVTPPFSYPMGGVPIVGSGYSPYLGHPIGMIRIPEPVGPPAFHGSSEMQNLETNSQSGSRPDEHSSMESAPPRQVHSHYTIVKHIKEQPAEPSQYHVQKASYPLRTDDNHSKIKLKQMFSTEAPAYVTTYPSPHFSQPISTNPHLPRLHGPSVIIVKRT